MQNSNGIFICQEKYAQKILTKLEMENSKPIESPIVSGTRLCKEEKGSKVDLTIYEHVVGSMMYLTATSLDIMYGVSLINRFMASHTEEHWSIAKRIMRYLKGTN